MSGSARPDDDNADVFGFLGDDPAPRPKPSRPSPARAVPAGDEFEVEGGDADDDLPPPPRAAVAPKRVKPSRRADDDDATEARRPAPEATVTETWNRWGEWGPTLIRLLVVGAATVVLAYMISGSNFGYAFLVLLAGLAVMIALSYPIAVTLERPVRMTPEQALKDYFGAASHHSPQYRRMWLLLSDSGKASRQFDSLATFQSYWKHRMAKLRGTKVKSSAPLSFVVADFKGDKSAGMKAVDGSYSVVVSPRGGEPLATIRVSSNFAKGPDNMWYLNEGTLPEDRRDEA